MEQTYTKEEIEKAFEMLAQNEESDISADDVEQSKKDFFTVLDRVVEESAAKKGEGTKGLAAE